MRAAFAIGIGLCVSGCDSLFSLARVPPDARLTGDAIGADADDATAIDAPLDADAPCVVDMFSSGESGFDTNWNRNEMTGCTLQVVGGELVITIDANFTCYARASSKTTYALSGSHIAVEVPAIAAGAADTLFTLRESAADIYYFTYNTGSLAARVQINGTNAGTTSVAYSAVTHRHWAFELRADELAFLTSPDGSTWTDLAVSSNMPATDQLTVELSAGTVSAAGNPVAARFDNFTFCP